MTQIVSPVASLTEDAPAFLAGGGAMGEHIRAHDWASTPLGPPAAWPTPLRTAVRILLTTNHPVFIFWGPEHRVLYNDAYSRSLGPEKHPGCLGVPGRRMWDEIWPIIGPQLEQVMEGRGATWHENHLVPITRNGRRENVYWTYSYSPIDDETAPHGVGGVLVLCTETTPQVEAAERLRAAEQGWRDRFEQAPGFMCTLAGPRHVFTFANPNYIELVGRRDLIGQALEDVLPWAAEQGFGTLLDAVYTTGVPYVAWGAEVAVPVPGKAAAEPGGLKRSFVDFVYQPIRDDAGAVTGIFVLGSDVTERCVAEARKNEFLAMLAHELRNPLAPIRHGFELVRRRLGDDPALARPLDVIERQLRHMVRLIDDLLDMARVDRGLLELDCEPTRLADVISMAVETAAPYMQRNGHDLKVDVAEPEQAVVLDGVRIAQVLSNLLINACKYSPAGSRVDLAARREVAPGGSAWLVLRVRDRGVGIAVADRERVFEMFVQLGELHPRAQGGLGIGLSLARHLVALHGGTIKVESGGPGEGSEFVVRLPLQVAEAAAPQRSVG